MMFNNECEIKKLIKRMGIPQHLQGYEQLAYAISVVIDYPEELQAVVKSLYPRVGQHFKTSASRTERNIRHAIELSLDHASHCIMSEVFGNTLTQRAGRIIERPTVSHYIAACADYLKVERGCKSIMEALIV